MALPRTIPTKIISDEFDAPILLLGRVGENLATRVVIDASEWHATGGEYQLIVKRADSEIFTATISVLSDVITWTIPAAEIGAAGYGEIELNYLTDGIKAKTARCDTRVFSSVEIDSLPPSGTTWSQLVLAAVGDSRDAADDAQAAQEGAQQAQGESSTYAENAAESASAAVTAKEQAEAARDDALDPLANATIRETTETATFDGEGRVISIVHTDNGTGEVVRTDTFTYAGEMITEVRALPNGDSQTNIYDMRNLVFQFDV